MTETKNNVQDGQGDWISVQEVNTKKVFSQRSRPTGRRNYVEQNNEENQNWGQNEKNSGSDKVDQDQLNKSLRQDIKKQVNHQPRNLPRPAQKQQEAQQDSSSGDDWDEQPNQKQKKEKKKPVQQQKQPQKEEEVKVVQKVELQPEQNKKLNESNWILQDLDKPEEKPKQPVRRGNRNASNAQPERKARGNRGGWDENDREVTDQKKKVNTMLTQERHGNLTILHEIEADEKKQINTSWVAPQNVETQPKTHGTRGNRQSRSGQDNNNNSDRDPPVRGNRGNRQTTQPDNEYQNQRGDGFKKKSQYGDGNRGGYNNSNNYNNYNGYGRGGRGRGTGYRDRKDGQGPNRDYRQKEYRQKGNYNNNRGNMGQRNQPYEHVNRHYQKKGNYNRSENDFRREDRDRYSDNNYNYAIENERKAAKLAYQTTNSIKQPQRVATTKKQEAPETSPTTTSTKTLKIQPRGQKCWPEMSMYIMQARLSFSFRQITEHECDILIIPYRDLKFEMYPGNIINKCKADYRKKIADKGAEVEEVGYLYPQKCVGIQNFKAIGFLKMGKGANQNRVCIAGILPKIKQLKMPVSTILIPYSKQMGQAQDFIKTVIESLSKFDGFVQVNISTNNAADFKAGVKGFMEEVSVYIDQNKICIDY